LGILIAQGGANANLAVFEERQRGIFVQTLTDDFILSDKLYIAYKNEDMNPKLLKRLINVRKEELPFYHIMNEKDMQGKYWLFLRDLSYSLKNIKSINLNLN
jgi:hypothetical protein